MKPGRTLGFIAVLVGGLLVTLTSVYANHFIAGGGRYSLAPDGSETSVRFRFLGVASASSLPEVFVPVIQTRIRCTVVHKGGDMSFRLVTSGTELDPFTVERLNPPEQFPRRVTLTGKMLSKIVVGAGSERRHFTEIAPFEAVGVDAATPGAGKDSFTLTIHYSASQDTGPLLLEALGTEFVTCNAATCTLTVTGTLTDGEVEGHTSGGD
jgi:hypothetical protein